MIHSEDPAGSATSDNEHDDGRHEALLGRLRPFIDASLHADTPPPEVAARTEQELCRDVADLAETCTDLESDPSALLCIIAVFEWIAKTRADDNDLATTLGLYRAIDRRYPGYLPSSIRALFEQLDPDTDLYGLLGTSVLNAALQWEDQYLINGSVRLLKRALSRLPAAASGRAALLGNLAAAAQATDRVAGTEQSLAAFAAAALDFAAVLQSEEAAEGTKANSGLNDMAFDMLADGLPRLVDQATGRPSLRRAVAVVRSVTAMRPSDSASYVRLCLVLGAALTAQGVRLADGPALREASRLALAALRQPDVTVAQTGPLLGIAGQSGALRRVIGDTSALAEQDPGAGERASALAGALRERLSGYARTGDPVLVLDDAALKVSLELLAIAHVEVAASTLVSLPQAGALAGELHWVRFCERRRGRAPDDDPASGASIVVIPHDGQEFTEIRLVFQDDPASTAEANAAIAHYALLPPGEDETVPVAVRTECAMTRRAADSMAMLTLRRSLDLLSEYDRSGDPDLARQALAKLTAALCSPYTDPQPRDFLARRLGDALVCLYGIDEDPGTLAAGTAIFRMVAASPRISPDYRAAVLASLAKALALPKTPDAAGERVRVLISLLRGTAPDDPDWIKCVRAVGAALADAWHLSPARPEFARAQADARAAIADACENPDDRSRALAALSEAVVDLNGLDDDHWDIKLLRSALALAREAVEISPASVLARLTLAKALRDLAEAAGDPATMTEAGGHYRAALAQAGPGDHLYPMAQSAMGNFLRSRFEDSGDLAFLREAAKVSGHAVETTSPDHYHYPQILINFTSVAVTVAEEATDASALPGLIEALRGALEAQHGNDETADMLAGSLVMAIHAAWYRGVPGAELEEAVRMAREALKYAVPQIRHAKRLSTLGYLLREMHIVRHEPELLDESVAVLREAVAIFAACGLTDAITTHNLAASLGRRARRLGDGSALDEAIGLLHAARKVAVGRQGRAVILSTLGDFLAQRQITRAEGIEFLREAVEITPPGYHHRDRYLSAASSALRASYEATGDISELNDAIRFGEEACSESRGSAVVRAANMSLLASCYQERAKAHPTRDDISRAYTLIREASQIVPPDSGMHPVLSHQLGSVCLDIADHSGDAEILAPAANLFRHVATMSTADTVLRAQSAQSWGEAAARTGDSSAAFEAFSLVVELLDQVAWQGLETADQESRISHFSGAARTAAAWALECGDAKRAVELLEQGRGRMLSRALAARTSFDELAAVAPELAERLSWVLTELSRPPADVVAATDLADIGTGRPARYRRNASPVTPAEADSDRRIRLAREREGLLAEIRVLPGFADFLRSPRFEGLRAAAAGGPVVIVNVAELRCDALVITQDDVRAVPLPGLTEAMVANQANVFTGCLVIMEGRTDFDLSMIMRARQEVISILEWLWDGVAAPVLQATGMTAPTTDPARLWWCPTGDFCYFPLHAAGRYARDAASAQSLLDYAVSSYTPTVTFLARQVGLAQWDDTGGAGRSGSALLIAVPAPASGDEALLAVSRDIATFVDHFPDGRVLADDAATAEAVLSAIGGYQTVHFACHAQQHVGNPSSGYISTHDGPVTVRELRERTAPRGQLALLMGCETARGGRRLADEAITMATALQLAGFRHAVGTLWSVDDADANAVARHVYQSTGRGCPGAPSPGHSPQQLDAATAYAVHNAVQKLRADYPFAPNRWTSIVHLGP